MKGDAPNQTHTYLNQKVKILTYDMCQLMVLLPLFLILLYHKNKEKKAKGAQNTSGLVDGGVSMILAVVPVQVQRCDLLKFLLKLGYRCTDLEQMAEYSP